MLLDTMSILFTFKVIFSPNFLKIRIKNESMFTITYFEPFIWSKCKEYSLCLSTYYCNYIAVPGHSVFASMLFLCNLTAALQFNPFPILCCLDYLVFNNCGFANDIFTNILLALKHFVNTLSHILPLESSL